MILLICSGDYLRPGGNRFGSAISAAQALGPRDIPWRLCNICELTLRPLCPPFSPGTVPFAEEVRARFEFLWIQEVFLSAHRTCCVIRAIHTLEAAPTEFMAAAQRDDQTRGR